MSLTSKSPRTVAIVALEVGRQTLPDYAHRFAPKIFTQPQLFACLVLKAFFRTDYRGIERYLHDLPELCRVLGLKRIPDHSGVGKGMSPLIDLWVILQRDPPFSGGFRITKRFPMQ